MRQRDTKAMLVPEADRSSSEVRVTKLSPDEIDKIFKDVKPEPRAFKPDYTIRQKAEDFDPAWLFDRPKINEREKEITNGRKENVHKDDHR